MVNLKSILGLLYSNDKLVMTEDDVDTDAYGIEYGGNSGNGHVKYPDGTLICYIKGSPATATTVYTFSHAFIAIPIAVCTASSAGLAVIMTSTPSETGITVYRWRHDGTTLAATYGINVIAIGRWK
jgi:hypothetical protein